MPEDDIIDLRDAQPIAESVDTQQVDTTGLDRAETDLVGGEIPIEAADFMFDSDEIDNLASVGAPDWMINRAHALAQP